MLKLRVANYELNLQLQLVKHFLSQTLKLAVANVFYGLNFKSHVRKTNYLKPHS